LTLTRVVPKDRGAGGELARSGTRERGERWV